MTAALCFKPRSVFIPDFYGFETKSWVIFPHEWNEFIKQVSKDWKVKGISDTEIGNRLKEIGLPTIEAVYDFVATQKLLQIEAEEISSFPGNNDGIPIIIPIISNELKECRKNLVECLDKNKIEYDKKYPEYKPHLTLSYADSKEKFKSRKLPEKLSWMAHELVIKIGHPGPNRIEVKFPLGLNKESKAKFMSNLFRKIS
jgi:hypothetical protein